MEDGRKWDSEKNKKWLKPSPKSPLNSRRNQEMREQKCTEKSVCRRRNDEERGYQNHWDEADRKQLVLRRDRDTSGVSESGDS